MSNKSKEENYKKEIRKKITHPTKSPTRSSKNKEYSYIPPERFYTEKEEVTLRFYQTPKALFKNPTYKGLSLGAKLMYSVLRDRLDMSIKNNWKDNKGYIYLMFSGEELLNLLEISKNTVTKYKRELVKYRLIIDKRLGQGKSNRLYVLKPEIKEFLIPNNWDSRFPENTPLESQKIHPNDTYVNDTEFNNVKENVILKKVKRSQDKELFAKEISEQLEDSHSLGFYRKIVDLVPENLIYQALSEVKDTYLMGKVKKSRAALFNAVIQARAKKNNINLNINKTGK